MVELGNLQVEEALAEELLTRDLQEDQLGAQTQALAAAALQRRGTLMELE